MTYLKTFATGLAAAAVTAGMAMAQDAKVIGVSIPAATHGWACGLSSTPPCTITSGCPGCMASSCASAHAQSRGWGGADWSLPPPRIRWTVAPAIAGTMLWARAMAASDTASVAQMCCTAGLSHW